MKDLAGYKTLKDAEPIYKESFESLKKKCQRGEIIGAIKQGKTWFVPRIPGKDPQKTLTENYPDIDFELAVSNISRLYDAENDARSLLYPNFEKYILIWEHSYYILTWMINSCKPDPSYAPIIVHFTEAHSSIRSAFLVNLYGYHPEAMTLLRRTHESVVVAFATKIKPNKAWTYAFIKSGAQSPETALGINLKKLYQLESSFVHKNQMKVFKAAKEYIDGNLKGISYGPQVDKKTFAAVANISLVWLYCLISGAHILFPRQISSAWLNKQETSAEILKDYLSSVESKLSIDAIQQFDDFVNKFDN